LNSNGSPTATSSPSAPPKTAASRRLVALDRHTVRLLREHRRRQRAEQRMAGEVWQDSGYVFTTEDGMPLHPDFLTRRFRYLVLA
jgi:integrase